MRRGKKFSADGKRAELSASVARRVKAEARRCAADTPNVAARRFACYDAVEFIDAAPRAGRGMTKSVVSFFKRSMYKKTWRVDLHTSQSARGGVLCVRGLRRRGHTAPLGLALRSARRALQTCRERRAQKFRPASRRSVARSGAVLPLYIDGRCIFCAVLALCATPRASRRLPPRRAARRGRTPRRRPARRGLSGGPRR